MLYFNPSLHIWWHKYIQCAGCEYGGLDFSSGLFDFFGSESLGVLTGSWVFGAGEPVSSSTTSTSTLTWTSTSQPPPSSTSSVTSYTTSNSTTSTQTPTPTTSTQSSTSTSISATPTPSQVKGNIAELFLVIIDFGSILAVAHQSWRTFRDI